MALQELDYYFVIATTKVAPRTCSNPSNLYCMAKTGLVKTAIVREHQDVTGVFLTIIINGSIGSNKRLIRDNGAFTLSKNIGSDDNLYQME